MVTPVNFFQPGTDPAIDQNQILRQRALADMLTQKSMTPDQGQMVSGHYVAPGAGTYIAQLVNALGGVALGRKSDQNERDMGQALAASRQKDAAGIMSAMQGTPAVPAQNVPLNVPNDDEGNPLPPAGQTAAIPAQGPDLSKALGIALQSQDPTMRGMAGPLMTQNMQAAQLAAALGGTGGAGGAPGGGVVGTGPGQISPAVAKLMAAGPVGEKLAGMVNDANKPVALREGDLVAPDGQGGVRSIFSQPKLGTNMQVTGRDPATGQVLSAGAVPGTVGAVGALSGAQAQAEAQAKAASTMVTVDTPQGPKMMTVQQAQQLAGGNQPPVAPPQAPQPSPARGAFAGTPEQVLDQINGLSVPDAVKAQMRQAYASQMAGSNPAYAGPPGLATPPGNMAQPGQPAPLPPQAPQGPGIALQDDSSKKFGQQVATQSADALLASRDKAKGAVNDLLNIGQARNAIKAGAYQGTGANWKLDTANFLQSNLGVKVDPEKVGNTGYLQSTLGSTLLGQAKTLGTNPTDADARRLEAILGTVGTDPKAMDKILDWREEMASRAISGHNDTVTDAEKRGMVSPYDLRVQMPQPPKVASQPTAPTSAPAFKIIKVH